MSYDNQKALDAARRLKQHAMIPSLSPRPNTAQFELDFLTIQAALTAQPVADDEVRDAVRLLNRWPKVGFFKGRVELQRAIETLIRAATAPKNCDALVNALEYYAQEGIYRAKIYDADIFNDYGEKARKALAAHRAQEGK